MVAKRCLLCCNGDSDSNEDQHLVVVKDVKSCKKVHYKRKSSCLPGEPINSWLKH